MAAKASNRFRHLSLSSMARRNLLTVDLAPAPGLIEDQTLLMQMFACRSRLSGKLVQNCALNLLPGVTRTV